MSDKLLTEFQLQNEPEDYDPSGWLYELEAEDVQMWLALCHAASETRTALELAIKLKRTADVERIGQAEAALNACLKALESKQDDI